MFIHQLPNWPNFSWDNAQLMPPISQVRNLQGLMVGRLSSLGFETKDSATIEAMSLEIVKSNAIEGEKLNREDVRSSVARKLGKVWPEGKIDRNIQGYVDVMFDATKNCHAPLTHDRLFGWHSAIFPSGRSGMDKIIVGDYRNLPGNEMVVKSDYFNREIIYFKAPNDEFVKPEMGRFLDWFNTDLASEPIIKSGVAHLWFLTIHPFEDGNGRMARAISDMQLSRSDTSEFRFYSISDQIEKKRKEYYNILERTQRGDLDLTSWLSWYLQQLKASLEESEIMLDQVVKKAEFWIENNDVVFNDRQIKIINMLFDGFEGNLTTSKYAKICKCSEDSALRDISDMTKKGVLKKGKSGGRSSFYY